MNHQTVIRANPTAFLPADGQLFRAVAFGGVPAVFASIIRKAVRWNRQRRAADELRALSNKTLKDIGVHRSEILSVVNTGIFERKVRRYAHD